MHSAGSTSELGDIAYQWFVGRDLATGELHKIGATSPISSAKAARNGLQLLSALCQREGTALIVYCDQFEKLVLDADNRLDRDAAGIFHSLVEVLPKHNAMLMIAGNDRAWNRLPQDLQQRFGYKVAQARGLELHEAEALVRLYLRPRDELRSVPTRDDPPIDEEDLHPFTRDGLRLLHLYSGGNPRILLQLCGAAWDEADGNLIDEGAARAAAHGAGAEPVDPESALAAVRALGEARGFTVKQMRGANSAGLRLAYKGQDRLAILLGQSTHYYDEVLDASKHVDSFVKLQKSAPEAKPMVLALGYDSPEVRDKLEKAGIEVLSYDPRTFADDFGRVLASLTRDEGTVAADEALTQELAELRQQLEALRVEREADVRGLAAQASAVEASQTEEQLGVRWQRALNDWAGERRRLEERISDARKARRVDDLEQLARLRAHAERDRDRRARIIWGAVAILVALTLTGVALTSDAELAGGHRGSRARRHGANRTRTVAVLASPAVRIVGCARPAVP